MKATLRKSGNEFYFLIERVESLEIAETSEGKKYIILTMFSCSSYEIEFDANLLEELKQWFCILKQIDK